ncbi:MAG: dephospho-CoA kinase [Bacteroidales bacterium]
MIKVGLTGGIGCGKSTVGKIFIALGVPLYDSDYEAKQLYVKDLQLKTDLISIFGKEVYLSNGNINKEYLSKIVFTDKNRLDELNKLVHPLVKRNFEAWQNSHFNEKYIIKEAAILFESGAYKQVDKIVLVVSPEELRIKRIIERDKLSVEQVKQKMNQQMIQDELVKRSDYIIVNDENKALLPQVLNIHNILAAKENKGL